MVRCVYCGKGVRAKPQPDGKTVRAETHLASRYPRQIRCQGSHESYELDRVYGRANERR